MKLLLLNWLDRENPAAGGAEVHLHESFGRLVRDRGWEVTLVASGWPGAPARVELDGLLVHRVGGRHTFALRAAPYIRRELRGEHFDLAVEDLNKIPLFLPRWAPAPTVLLVHHLFGREGFQAASFPIALTTWCLERMIPRAYRKVPVVAVSESTRADLVDRGMAGDRIQVVENGIDLSHYSPAAEEERFPEPTLLYLGRLRRYKRVDLILQGLARLRGKGIAARLLIAGRGDAELELREEARRLGLGENMAAFLGWVPEETKLELLRRSWVHVLTSPREGWGIANLEAAACGTPTVASDAPGLRDSVRHQETGFLVPHGDTEALAQRLELMVLDHNLRARMGAAARSFSEGFSWDATSARLGRALEEAVPQEKP